MVKIRVVYVGNFNIRCLLFEFEKQAFCLRNNPREFTTLELCTQKPVLIVKFKDFWFTKINLSQKYIMLNNKKNVQLIHA